MIKKIVAIGPESTGKSTLCEQLADHFKTSWCPEYAREYLNTNGVKYKYNDLIKITKDQLKLEDNFVQNMQLIAHSSKLFFDTNMCVMKVWYEYVFGKCEHLVLDEIASRKYDLYLLCNIDLPWVAEDMREYPDKQPRIELFNMYKDLLINQTTPWVEINGNYDERLQIAINAVNHYC